MMPVMTFVGKSFAKIGLKYYFEGVHPGCPKSCNLYATCQKNLIPNTLYEVIEIKPKTFTCPHNFHQEDMVLVKMDEPKLQVSMFNKDIFEGSMTAFGPVECDREDCEYIDYCAPQTVVILSNQKIKILKIIKKIKNCPRELNISLVKIEKRSES
ncbi:MAG: UPF0179 family protein [Promethearchaeota archaeon]